MSEYAPRIKFTVDSTDYDLGQMAWFTPTFEGNVMTRIIPRAKGVQIYSGEEMGGGLIRITISAFKIANSRIELETYLLNLINNIANKKGTLTIESTLTMQNCVLTSIKPSEDHHKWSHFTIEFVKSL